LYVDISFERNLTQNENMNLILYTLFKYLTCCFTNVKRFRTSLRKIFEPKKPESGEWRKLHDGTLIINRVCYATEITSIKVIKLRRTGWFGHVVQKAEIRNAYKTFVGRPEGKEFGGVRFGGRTM
jgi:hypothetical protein